MSRRLRTYLLFCLTFVLLSSDLLARVISYAPYTSRAAVRSIHHRLHRYFALIESVPSNWTSGQVVLYDVLGESEPRVIYPGEAEFKQINFVLVSSHTPGSSPVPVILLGSYENSQPAYLISSDSGSSWTPVTGIDGWPLNGGYPGAGMQDFGGPYSHGLSSPYMVDALHGFVINTSSGIYTIGFDGKSKQVVAGQTLLLGRNAGGTQLLVRTGTKLMKVDATGTTVTLGDLGEGTATSGWITPDGSAYVHVSTSNGFVLYLYRNATRTLILQPYPGGVGLYDPLGSFGVPTAGYDGAWMIQRRTGMPTVLSRHTIANGTETMWSDVSGPLVEALHTTTADANKLLIQVHRPRKQSERWFIDPALAVWRAGDPAPRAYDELFLNEAPVKGFVYLDVNTVANGTPFVFDSGTQQTGGCEVCSPGGGDAGGGADVTQEWGVVRASLKQRLVLPGVARQPGAFASYWLTDVVIRNPLDRDQRVDFRFVPLGEQSQAASVSTAFITLAAQEIRVLKDVLMELFAIQQGGGALYIEPADAVTATSRTYTRAGEGTFGFNMGAIDVLNSAGPRFPVSFAGAFPGENFRTNMILTDTSGRGTEARLIAHGVSGRIGLDTVAFSAPTGGLQQLNFLQGTLGLAQHDAGGMMIHPTRGTAIATVVAMDNRTNDPTYFPPDLSAPDVRTIPVIGHVDGAFNSKFRSDVFIINTSPTTRTLRMEAKAWDSPSAKTLNFTLLPGEARVIRDALPTLFQMTGVARLRYGPADFMGDGIRVTSRTYNVNEGGGTYGTLIPPQNSFQSAANGERLEILGVIGGTGFRTNVGLVDLSPAFDGQTADARIYLYDDRGTLLDQFPIQIATAGGTQINDIFGSRGIPQPKAALIVIEVSKGLIGAYATLTDNVTNDSSYLGANLAAQPN